MKKLIIEWQRLLDEQKQTCPRCGSTELEVEKAVQELNRLLSQSGVFASLTKKAIDPESFKRDVLQSNKILIAGTTPKPVKANVVKPAETRNVELLSTPMRSMRRYLLI